MGVGSGFKPPKKGTLEGYCLSEKHVTFFSLSIFETLKKKVCKIGPYNLQLALGQIFIISHHLERVPCCFSTHIFSHRVPSHVSLTTKREERERKIANF